MTSGTITKNGNFSSLYVAKGAELRLNGELTVEGSFINEGTIIGNNTINITGTNTNGCNPPTTALPYSNTGTIYLCPNGTFNLDTTSNFTNNGTIKCKSYTETGGVITNKKPIGC